MPKTLDMTRILREQKKQLRAGFQDRLVMTASITLRRVSFAKCSGMWREFRERTMKFLFFRKCRKPLSYKDFCGNKRNFCAQILKTASLCPVVTKPLSCCGQRANRQVTATPYCRPDLPQAAPANVHTSTTLRVYREKTNK